MARKKATKKSLKALTSKAVANTKANETRETGIVRLPHDINNAVAELTEVVFDTYKKGAYEGEYYCRMSGIIKSPAKSDGGSPIKGLRTGWGPEPICDTKRRDGTETSLEDHVNKILNQFRLLGLETAEYDDNDLEKMGEDLVEAAPNFRFGTTPRYDVKDLEAGQPKEGAVPSGCWENWGRVIEEDDLEDDVEDDDVEDDTDDDEVDADEVEEDDVEEDDDESDDEVEEDDVEDDDSESEEVEAVEKEDIYFYDGPDGKVECEVIRVVKSKKLCTLKALEGGKTYKSVPWTKLSY